MKRTLWAWSFYHPSVMILRSRCDSRLAGVNQDSCDLWGLGEVRVVLGTEQSTDCEEEEEGKEEKKYVSEDFISLKHFMVSNPFSPQRKFKNSSMLRRER